MHSNDHTLRTLLYTGDQYVIPLFQRYYVWDSGHWNRLWNDLNDFFEEQDSPKKEHFLGAMVCMPADHVPGRVPAYVMIDGQQRLVTLVILLCSIRNRANELGLDNVAAELQENYLEHKYRDGLEKYKVLPRIRDRQSLIDIVEGRDPSHQDRIFEAYEFFKAHVRELAGDRQTLDRLFVAVTAQLSIVMITLKEENPFAIFETLNATGQKLEESDLIRNYMFMKIPFTQQEAYDDSTWQPFEDLFKAKVAYPEVSISDFYRDYLMRAGSYVSPKRVYVSFKKEAEDTKVSVHELGQQLTRYARLYLQIMRPTTADEERIRAELSGFSKLDASTAYPLLLNLLARYDSSEISRDELIEMIHGIESFTIRRSIVGESTRPYYRLFPAAAAKLENGDVKESLFGYLDERGWPSDRQFKESLVSFEIYWRTPEVCRLALNTLELSSGHKEQVNLSNLQIEHVMPRTISDDDDGKAWKAMLGSDWEDTQNRWLHTLGNLTLTGYNPELSNASFDKKKEWYAQSHIGLNGYFAQLDRWDATTIQDRGRKLAEGLARIYPCHVAAQPTT